MIFTLLYLAELIALGVLIYVGIQYRNALFSQLHDLSLSMKAAEKNLADIQRIIAGLFVVDPKVSGPPNEVMSPPPDTVEFSENTFIDVPKDLKFEIEGTSSEIPPGYRN